MSFLGLCVKRLGNAAHCIGRIFEGAGLPLTVMLPALLLPATLKRLIRSYYDRSYDDTYTRFASASQEWLLEQWEEKVLARYHIVSGKILVLGTGIGRESIALAKRVLRVVGLDISRSALRMAAQSAQTAGVPVTFVQADFLALPTPAHFDYILLPSIMYSSIPSRSWRRTWLRQLTSLLSPRGLAVLQFLVDSALSTRKKGSAKPSTSGSPGFQEPTVSTSQVTPALKVILSMPFKANRNCARNCPRAVSCCKN